MSQPVDERARLESLDVLRGFALLGILLLNILGFGLVSSAYSNAGTDLIGGSALDIATWATVEMTAEGAMRCLFSILFGAGVLLFTTGERGKSAGLYYRRTFLLLLFGLFNAWVLLWPGDILVCYALSGALLFFFRNRSARTLTICAVALLVLISAFYGVIRFGLEMSKGAADEISSMADPSEASESQRAMAEGWQGFYNDFHLTEAAEESELAARRSSYASAFEWNLGEASEMTFTVLPMFLFWDALVMMLFGMALYKSGVLQGSRSTGFYVRLMIAGFAVGFTVNGYEVWRGISSNWNLFAIFAQMQPTYHLGRLGVALGYTGLLILLVHKDLVPAFRRGMAAVGRMALTNYLMQSLICLFVFTGTGFALVGELSRAGLYPVVFAIWIFQITFSIWWLSRYRFGPVEWLWRALTYGEAPAMARHTETGSK